MHLPLKLVPVCYILYILFLLKKNIVAECTLLK